MKRFLDDKYGSAKCWPQFLIDVSMIIFEIAVLDESDKWTAIPNDTESVIRNNTTDK